MDGNNELNVKVMKKAFVFVATRENQEIAQDWPKPLRLFRNFTLFAFDIGFYDFKTSSVTMYPASDKNASKSVTLSKCWVNDCPSCTKDVEHCKLEPECIDFALMSGLSYILAKNDNKHFSQIAAGHDSDAKDALQ